MMSLYHIGGKYIKMILRNISIKELNMKKISDLNKEYDKLQIKYGSPELDSIYNGGLEKRT